MLNARDHVMKTDAACVHVRNLHNWQYLLHEIYVIFTVHFTFVRVLWYIEAGQPSHVSNV